MKEMGKWKKAFEKDLGYICQELKELLDPPCVLVLNGEMGAGKTTLCRTLIPKLDVSSPTYSVVNELGRWAHADFYRLKSEDELVELELPLVLEEKDYFVVEWGKDYLRSIRRLVEDDFNYYQLDIEVCGEESRNYLLKRI